MPEPGYLHLLETGELAKRVDILHEMLRNCVLCPHQCKVNRLEGERGYCRTLEQAIVAAAEPHFGEEDELVGEHGSGTIFFSHCNLSCAFCQNYEISYCGEGHAVTAEELAATMLNMQRRQCHNINLVSPGHIIPQIVEGIYLAAGQGLKIPIVYNTNGYDLTDTLRFLDGIIDIYMPDIKFADDGLGAKYLGVKNYYTIARAAVKEMHRQVGDLQSDEDGVAYRGLLIRHLVMPENLAGTDEIMRMIAEELSPDSYVNIMAQYYPAHKASEFPELNRRISGREYEAALKAAQKAGLRRVEEMV